MSGDQRIIEVEIERILPGGVGLAHAEGLTLFVSLAAPGDIVRVELDRVRGKVGFATVKEIVKPSPFRVEPPCPYFGRCGGCDFQQLTYESQLAAKAQIIADCLQRIAKLPSVPDITVEPSPKEWQYRSRAGWQLDSVRHRLGYFEGGSHRVCDVEFCAVLTPELQGLLETLRGEMKQGNLDDYTGEIDVVAGDESISVTPGIAALRQQGITRKVGDETYEFNAESFFQINHDLLGRLLAEALGDSRGERAVDLYCGVGLFTIPLARRFKEVIGVEAHSTAVSFARRNLERAGLVNAEVVGSRVGDWLLNNAELAEAVDLLVLDPPRTGAEPSAIKGILSLRPKQITYVSCDPATLARDLKQLIDGGYELDYLKGFDMFPQTHHVETIVKLHAG